MGPPLQRLASRAAGLVYFGEGKSVELGLGRFIRHFTLARSLQATAQRLGPFAGGAGEQRLCLGNNGLLHSLTVEWGGLVKGPLGVSC